uniref:Vasoactive intestinal peptide n=1 Tax=Leptobrachium leishanense TaxID=445787 RepID=A0A8C5QD30_9ANUR
MEHRHNFLVSFTLFSVLYLRTLALPPLGTYSNNRLANRLPFEGAGEPDQSQGSLKSDSDMLQSTLPDNEKFFLDMSRAVGSWMFTRWKLSYSLTMLRQYWGISLHGKSLHVLGRSLIRNDILNGNLHPMPKTRVLAITSRHADGLFTSGYSKLLGQLSARKYLESLIGKRVSNNVVDEQVPVKRHSDAVFTDNYSRFRKQMAVKKYLNSVLTGKRSQDDINPASLRDDIDLSQPPFSENYDDATIDELINHLPLNL